MAVELEGLEFQIEAKSTNASKGIDALVASLTKLKGAVSGKNGLAKVCERLDAINKAVSGNSTDKLETLSKALNTLNSVRISPTIPKRLSDIGAALDSITPDGIDRVERLSVALQGMDGVNIPNLRGLNQAANPAPAEGGDTGGAGAQNAPNDVSDATDEIVRATSAAQVLKNVLSGMGGVFSKTFSVIGKGALKSLQAAMKGLTAAAKAAVSAGKNLVHTFGARMAAKVKQTTSGFGKLFASIKRIAMYRLIRFMFSQLTKAIKEGVNNLYQYSLLMDGTFSKSMDRCATSFLYLKNSMGAMVAPLINAIAPALDMLIDKVVALMNIFNQFMASLTGAKTYTVAKKMATSYAESAEDAANKTKKAAKEIKDATGSIDELNIISQKDNGSDKEIPDYGSMFEELPVDSVISDFAKKLKLALELENWEELGKLLGQKFNDIIDGIDWAGIGRKIGNFLDGAIKTAYHFLKTADFYGLGKHLAELINNALAEIDGEYIGRLLVRCFTVGLDVLIGLMDGLNWALLGRTIGNAIQGAISEAYNWLVKVGDFSRFGKYIATAINSALNVIDCEMLGRTIYKILTILPDILIGLIKNLNWKLVGKSIGDFIKGALNETSDWIKKIDWSQLAHDIYTGIKNCFVGLDFAGIAKAFFRLLGSALGAGVSFIVTFISDVITDIKNYFLKYIQDENGDGKFGGIEIIKGLLLGIWEGIKNIGTWIKENVFDPFIQGFKDCFGIHSPSKVMRELGHYIVEGFLEGLNLFSTIGSKVKEWAGKVIEWFTKGQDGKGLVENFKELGGKIVNGFKDKIGSTYTTVKGVVTTWATNVKEWFTNSSFNGVNLTTFQTYANNIITGFREKVNSTYTTVKSAITTWGNGVKDWFTNNSFGGVNSNTFSTFANTTIEGFRTKISAAYTNTKACITTWATNVKEWFTGSSHDSVNSNTFQTFANNVITGFKDKITSAYSNTKSCIVTWATSVKSWFSDIASKTAFGNFASDVISGFKDKISSTYSTVQSSITTWANSVKTWFSNIVSNSAFSSIASDVVSGFKSGISSTYTTVKSTVESWGSSVKTWFTNYCSSSSFYSIASDVVSGFKNGIGALYSTCKNTISSWGSSIIDWFKKQLDSHSPSKVFERIGKDTVLGYNLGIQNLGNSTKSVVGNWADSFTNISPTLALSVDTSALGFYDSAKFSRSISANFQTSADITADGFEEAMERFYREYVQPTMNQIADDMRRQADKDEHPVVQVGNRVITDAVETQKKANGYSFTK